MRNIIVVLTIGLVSRMAALSQGLANFDIDFGTNPPPHTLGDPVSGATLTNNTFYAILYLDATEPVAGFILQSQDATFTRVFQFTNLVFATYPGGGPAYDFESSWQLTQTQIDNLMAGQWYAEVTYNDVGYIGHIIPASEPPSLIFLLAGLAMISARRCGRNGLSGFWRSFSTYFLFR